MKKTTILITLLILICTSAYSQDINIDKNTTAKPVLLGFNFAPGLSWNSKKLLSDGEKYINFSMDFGIKGMFSFSNITGLILGMQFSKIKLEEKNSSVSLEHNLSYFQLTISPFLRFKNLFFSTGLYIDFIISGEQINNSNVDIDNKKYTLPNLGLIISVGYLINIYKIFSIYIDLKLKYGLNDFLKDSLTSPTSNIFGLYLDISFFFKIR